MNFKHHTTMSFLGKAIRLLAESVVVTALIVGFVLLSFPTKASNVSEALADPMEPLSYLTGHWTANVKAFSSVDGIRVTSDTPLDVEFTQVADSRIVLFNMHGKLNGMKYEGGGAIFYDSKEKKYVKVWGDNIGASAEVSMGELLPTPSGSCVDSDGSVCLFLTDRDSSVTELVHRFARDSAAFIIRDLKSNTEISRFSLVAGE